MIKTAPKIYKASEIWLFEMPHGLESIKQKGGVSDY